VRRVLDDLQQQGLLNDSRAAEALVQAKAPRYGHRRLAQMLQQRSLGVELVAANLQQIRHTELERAREVWRRRFGQPPADLRERARQHRFLAARGFDGSVIDRVIKDAIQQAGAGDRTEPVDD
jgi:regulatory protein